MVIVPFTEARSVVFVNIEVVFTKAASLAEVFVKFPFAAETVFLIVIFEAVIFEPVNWFLTFSVDTFKFDPQKVWLL